MPKNKQKVRKKENQMAKTTKRDNRKGVDPERYDPSCYTGMTNIKPTKALKEHWKKTGFDPNDPHGKKKKNGKK